MTRVQTEVFSPSQIEEPTTRMSLAITFSEISGHSSSGHPCSLMSGQTPVAIMWSTGRRTWTEIPLFSMMVLEISMRPSVWDISGDFLSVQLRKIARKSE